MGDEWSDGDEFSLLVVGRKRIRRPVEEREREKVAMAVYVFFFITIGRARSKA